MTVRCDFAATTTKTCTAPEVNVTTRISVLDIDNEPTPKVTVLRHPVDFHNLADDVAERITATIVKTPIGCHYFNPAVTISCPEASPVFFAVIKKEQARWCRHAGKTILRKNRRSSSRWVSGGEWMGNKLARYFDRALCFTGILFIDGKFIPPHSWPRPPEITSTERRKAINTANANSPLESNSSCSL